MTDTDNVFDRACLMQLSIRTWQGQKMVEPSIMARIGDAEWLRGRKRLVDPDRLAGIRAVTSRARALLKRYALPFPIDGLSLVPKEVIVNIEPELIRLQADFNLEVDAFLAGYAVWREEAAEALGELFSETDYPADIRGRFGFQWRYVHLTLPGRSRVLPAELYQRERRKFLNLMDDARSQAVAALRSEFAGLVGHLAERLSTDGDRPKVLRASVVEKLEAFMAGFSDRDLFNDGELKGLVEQARQVLHGLDADSLRSDDGLRQRIGTEMERIKGLVDESLEDLPRRRIRIAA